MTLQKVQPAAGRTSEAIPCERGTALARETHETSFQGRKTPPWSPTKQSTFSQEGFILICDAAAQAAAHCRADRRDRDSAQYAGGATPYFPPQLDSSVRGAL